MDDIVLRTEGLTKDFAGFTAVSDVNLAVRRGTIHALIGPNGAGKTTVFNLITRFLPVTAGRIFFKDREITHERPASIARRGMVRSFQISAVFPHLTVRDNIGIALQRPSGLAFRFWQHEQVLGRFDRRIEELATAVDLAAVIDTPVVELAYGRKRALEIVTTLALDPEVVLLDEPMAGLAEDDIERITMLIKALGQTRTVVMVEHNISVVARLCDIITVLTRGRVLAEGPYKEISANPAVIEAYMGTSHVQ
jgi:branched-chain amino acid transport system ATP-binding protein